MPKDRLSFRVAALALLLLAASCHTKDAASNQRALQEWARQEDLLVQVANRQAVDLDHFEKACNFFLDLTGISVPVDHSPELGLIPTAESSKALVPLRRWYAAHKNDLYLDEGYRKVILRSAE
jgi:hypothetical protein